MENKWCAVCGSDLDAQGRCPKGHVESYHTKKETTLGLDERGRVIVKVIEATEELSQAMVFASYKNTGGAAMLVDKAKGTLRSSGLVEMALAPVMVPLDNITKSMPWAKMRDSIGYVLNQIEYYTPRWIDLLAVSEQMVKRRR